MAPANKIEIILSVKDDGSTKKIDLTSASVKSLGGAGLQAEKGLSAAKRGVQSISQSLDRLQSLAAGAFAVTQISQYATSFITVADSMRNMDQRLLLVSKNTADYAAAQKSVTEIASASHTSLADVNTLYSRMALATANLNVSQKDLADVTKTVALTVALSGSSASEASAGLQQFAQAMGASRLGGDELRSVLENMPQLTKVFVDAAGGSMATLREMAEKGELTTEWMIAAIKKGQSEIEKQAAGMPKTVAMAMTDLRNEAAKYIDEVNRSTGFTATLAGAINLLGKNLDTVANGGVAVLSAGVTYLVATSLTSLATMVITRVVPALIAMGTTTVTTSAAIVGVRSAITATSFSMGTMVAGLGSLLSPIGMVTAAVGLGAIAWNMWGKEGADALESTKAELAQMERMNQLMKEQSDPQLKLDGITSDIAAASSKVAELRDKLGESFGEVKYRGQFNDATARLNALEDLYKKTQENMAISAEKRGVKEIAVAMTVDDFKKKMIAETTAATAEGLEKELLTIKTRREAAEKDAVARFQDEGARREALLALNARYDAEANKAKIDAAAKSAQKNDGKAAREAAANAKEAEAAAKRQAEEQKKIAAERLRAASQEKIISLEMERLDASTLPTSLARAEAELAINRKMTAERVSLKQQELATIKADTEASQADILRAESELSEMRLEVARQELDGQRAIASEQLSLVEDTWRRGTGSVQEYQAAVQSAMSMGVIDKEEADRRMVLSGDNMTEALKLGFSDWAATVQTDAEFVAGMFGQVANSIGSGLAAAFDSMADGSKSAKDAVLDLARSTISMVAQMIAQQLIYNAIKSAGTAFGFSTGGPVAAFAGGGMVGGWSPSPKADNIPAWLTAREFVHPVASVEYYGAPFMEAVRRRLFPRSLARALSGMTLPRIPSGNRLAEGGMAAGSSASTTFKGGDTKLKVINVIDKHMVGDFMRTADGETALINMIRRNGSTIRTIIGA